MHVALFDDLPGRLLQAIDRDEPLLGKPGLERSVATIAMHDRMGMILDLVEQAKLFEFSHHCFARFIARHAREFAEAIDHDRMLIEDVDLIEIVALAYGIVIRVVSRRYLHTTSTEFFIHHEIGNDRYLAVHDGKHDRLAHQVLIALILRADRDARIAEHGLRARSGHDQVLHAIHGLRERIAQMPQVAGLFLVFRLVVGDSCGAMRAPVHDALAAEDKIIVVPIAEHLAHRA